MRPLLTGVPLIWNDGSSSEGGFSSFSRVVVEPIAEHVARMAGVGLTLLPKAQTIDALVMASACQRSNEIVYTSDLGDLKALRNGVPQFASLGIERAGDELHPLENAG